MPELRANKQQGEKHCQRENHSLRGGGERYRLVRLGVSAVGGSLSPGSGSTCWWAGEQVPRKGPPPSLHNSTNRPRSAHTANILAHRFNNVLIKHFYSNVCHSVCIDHRVAPKCVGKLPLYAKMLGHRGCEQSSCLTHSSKQTP